MNARRWTCLVLCLGGGESAGTHLVVPITEHRHDDGRDDVAVTIAATVIETVVRSRPAPQRARKNRAGSITPHADAAVCWRNRRGNGGSPQRKRPARRCLTNRTWKRERQIAR
jgi:hypothetical protein